MSIEQLASQDAHFFVAIDIPNACRFVVAGRNDRPSVRRQRAVAYPQPVSAQNLDALAIVGIPNANGVVMPGTDQQSSLLCEADAANRRRVPDQFTIRRVAGSDVGIDRHLEIERF